MNITLAFQELDDLVVEQTLPPATAVIRNKIHPLREQIEAYIEDQERAASLQAEREKLVQKLQSENAKLIDSLARLEAGKRPGFGHFPHGNDSHPIPGAHFD